MHQSEAANEAVNPAGARNVRISAYIDPLA